MPEERILEAELEGKTLLLVDGSSYLYRAYHAMPDLRGPDGGPTGALYGIINMLRRMRKEVTAEYSACVFDAKGKTFRDDWYPDYKANRPSMPEDLARRSQHEGADVAADVQNDAAIPARGHQRLAHATLAFPGVTLYPLYGVPK